MEDKYTYAEEWVKKTDTEGTLQVKEIQPAKGQSKNNIRSIEYDCSVDDLKQGLDNLKKSRDVAFKQFESIEKEKENLEIEIKNKNYSKVITPEMEKIMGIIENASLLGQLEAKNQDIKIALEQLNEANEKVKIREEVLKDL